MIITYPSCSGNEHYLKITDIEIQYSGWGIENLVSKEIVNYTLYLLGHNKKQRKINKKRLQSINILDIEDCILEEDKI